MIRYIIRYRCSGPHDRIALIVDDGCGDAYLFSGGRLQVRLGGSGASARMARMLGCGDACSPVPEVAPYTIDGLRYLITPPSARNERAEMSDPHHRISSGTHRWDAPTAQIALTARGGET